MPNKLTISLDYDDTFTADPIFWTAFVGWAQTAGHKVICVTSRFGNFGNRQELRDALPQGMEVVFCDHNGKDESARKAGYQVDIWIDDVPESIRPS